ncbi:MAG: transposase [Alkalibacterium sp.]|nr:transposase [Alkalibacterium sp.]
MQSRKKRRVFSLDFKKEVVNLYKSGKSRKEIIDSYNLNPSTFDKWVQQFKQSDLVLEEGEFTSVENEVQELRKKIAQLQDENKVLKEAAMIFARRTY